MKKLIDEILGGSESPNERPGFVFFNDENPEGYTSKDDFLTSLRKQKKDKPFRILHLKSLFDNMSENRNLTSEPTLSYDNGEEIIWVKFSYGKMRRNIQILNQGRMFDFISDYAAGKVRNVPNFTELLESIEKQ